MKTFYIKLYPDTSSVKILERDTSKNYWSKGKLYTFASVDSIKFLITFIESFTNPVKYINSSNEYFRNNAFRFIKEHIKEARILMRHYDIHSRVIQSKNYIIKRIH
jgi:hypothetical protein